MDCLSIQREGKLWTLYMKEREGKPNADCQSRSPMPSTSAEPSSSPWGQGRPTGASEADRGKRGRWGQARLVGTGETGGGRRGWWGQARPMGAVSRRAKSLVNIYDSGHYWKSAQPRPLVRPMAERPMWPCHSVYRETARVERTISLLDFLTAPATLFNRL
jgi:hypothetical protein